MTKINKETKAKLKAKAKIKMIKESMNIFNVGQRVIHEGKEHVVLAIFSTFNVENIDLEKESLAYSLCEVNKIKNMPVARGSHVFKNKVEYNKFDKERKSEDKKKKEAEEKAEFLKLKAKYDK